MSDATTEAVVDVTVPNKQGLHARPVMRFVDLASRYQSSVTVENRTNQGARVDGKSAMHMMLLEATKGCVLRIAAAGTDADEMVSALAALVESGFQDDPQQ